MISVEFPFTGRIVNGEQHKKKENWGYSGKGI